MKINTCFSITGKIFKKGRRKKKKRKIFKKKTVVSSWRFSQWEGSVKFKEKADAKQILKWQEDCWQNPKKLIKAVKKK